MSSQMSENFTRGNIGAVQEPSVSKASPAHPKPRRWDRKSPTMSVVIFLRNSLVKLQLYVLRSIVGMDIHPTARISLRANLDFTNPRGVHIGEGSLVAFHATILTHDMCRLWHTDTYVGKNCFIGAYSMILPGVRVGDGCIVGSGSVVTRDIPPNCIVAGNPAKIIRTDIRTMRFGVLEEAYRDAVEFATQIKGESV